MMLRWRNSRSKIDLVIKHLVTGGSHIFSQSWWQTFDLQISFRPASSVCACRSLKCVEPLSHQYFSNLSSRLLVSKTNKIHSKQWIWCFTKKAEENEQHLLVQGQVWLFSDFCCSIPPLVFKEKFCKIYEYVCLSYFCNSAKI